MRAQIITGCSGIGLAAVSFALPAVFPHVDPWLAKVVLGTGLLLIFIGFVLWVSSLKGKASGSGLTQATHGSQSPTIAHVNGDTHIHYAQPPPAATQPPKSPYGSGGQPAPVQRPSPEALVPNFLLEQLVAKLLFHQGRVPDDAEEAMAYFLRMELEIADKVHQRQMAVWGREGTEPASRLSKHDLRFARFDARQPRLSIQRTEGKPLFVYHDVTFNRRQVDEAWPLKGNEG